MAAVTALHQISKSRIRDLNMILWNVWTWKPTLGLSVEVIHGSGDEDHDPLEAFKAILEVIQFKEVSAFALQLRKRIADSEGDATRNNFQSAAVSVPPLTGSYHILFPIDFDDGIRWLLKVPGIGLKELWNDAAATSLSSEALTMQLLLRETTIRLPQVFDFSPSLENPLGVPFIVLEFVEGLSLYDVWFDLTVTKDELRVRRTHVLENIAEAMVQLSKFSFDRGGSVQFDSQGRPSGIGPYREVDNHAMLAGLDKDEEEVADGDDDDDGELIYRQYGPSDSTQSFFSERLTKIPEPDIDMQKLDLALLKFFVDLVPEPKSDVKPFVLAHPDFDIRNFIVSQDGELKAIIDWDGVATVPRALGNERYPGWLTRDWDPMMYAWREGMETDPNGETLLEDSPTTLKYDRGIYLSHIQSRKVKENATQSSQAIATVQSLALENLLIAIVDPRCTRGILQNLVTNVVAAAATERSGELGEEEEDFDYGDIAGRLLGGDLSQKWKDMLQTGFNAVLAGYGGSEISSQS